MTPPAEDTKPALIDQFGANRIRKIRELKFDRPDIVGKELPEYLNYVKKEIHLRARGILYQAYEIGKLLHDVKYRLPHGEFDNWVAENVPFSKSTALNYMRLYKYCLGHTEIIEFFKPSVLYEICTPKFPKNFRKLLFENVTGVFDTSKKELLVVAFKWKKGVVTPKSPEVQKLLKNEKDIFEYNEYKSELKSMKKSLENNLEKFKYLNKMNSTHPFLNEEDNAKDDRYFEIEVMIEGFIGKINMMIESLRPKQ
jgi:hypothetical protein